MKKEEKKLGRPPLPESEKKVSITFKTHPKNKAKYIEKADVLFGGNLSNYINYVLQNKNNSEISLPSKGENVDRAVFYALVRELNKIGANLNQLTRKANMGHFINDDLEKTLKELSQKKEELFAKLVDKLDENVPNIN
ncbi:MobC family plasmid mobilization relaxosome protein [Aquimarina mytili]|uniref:MobC family plasmid mobilization relaxosome protein n=1 Tax=Aquimarina mytili TaxID=874423 RepID=A0A936ZXF1_9FLAO|nr:MobC family plasmid mobilization relaxosome protein [Aquimarina mytili]MBL0686077.1 MobC family plasmid mobilization relaxosome protein [Aquimarina mytili]